MELENLLKSLNLDPNISLERLREMHTRRARLAQGFQLAKAIEAFSRGKLCVPQDDRHLKQLHTWEDIAKDLQEVRPFIFRPAEDLPKEVPHFEGYSDQPFDVVSIEAQGLSISISKDGDHADTYCVISVDRSPEDRYLLALIDVSAEGGAPVLTLLYVSRESGHWRFFSDIRELYMQKLHQERHAIVPVQHRARINNGKAKTIITLNEVVYVAPKGYAEATPTIGNRPVVWSHAWRCRGHWRRMAHDFLGKDRHGERNQNGRTWVTESVKGDGILVEKVRKGT